MMLYNKIKQFALPVILGFAILLLVVSYISYKSTNYIIHENKSGTDYELLSDNSKTDKTNLYLLNNSILEEESTYLKRRELARKTILTDRAERKKESLVQRKAQEAEGYVFSELTKEEIRYNQLVEKKMALDELNADNRLHLEAKKVGNINWVLSSAYFLTGLSILLVFLVFPVKKIIELIKEADYKPIMVIGGSVVVVLVLFLIGKSKADISPETLQATASSLNWTDKLEGLSAALTHTNGMLLVTYVLLGIAILGIIAGEVARIVRG